MGAIAIGRMYGPTTPLLLVCSNRPHGRVDDDVATQVPLHDLASRGPSAVNRTDGRYRSKTTGYPVAACGCMTTMKSEKTERKFCCATAEIRKAIEGIK